MNVGFMRHEALPTLKDVGIAQHLPHSSVTVLGSSSRLCLSGAMGLRLHPPIPVPVPRTLVLYSQSVRRGSEGVAICETWFADGVMIYNLDARIR